MSVIEADQEARPQRISRSGTARQPGHRQLGQEQRETRAGYLFLAPALVFFAIFLVLPMIFGILLSLSEWSGYDFSSLRFVGLDNYRQVLQPSGVYVKLILVNTLIFAAVSVSLSVVGAVVVASCIERLKAQAFWRFLYFLPVVATVVAIGNVWKMMYQPSGIVNGFLNLLGINSIGYLSDPNTALPAIAVTHAWATIGTAVLILTAGIKAIDRTFYEAAEIDGANDWQVFWMITVPLLRPSLVFVLITQCIGGLQSFALIIVMTQDGGPANATNVAGFEMFQQAFKFGAWGTASAMAMVLFFVILIIALIQLRLGRSGSAEGLS